MTTQSKVHPQLKTLKSVRRLVFDNRPDTRAMRKAQGYWSPELSALAQANDDLVRIVWDMTAWSRAHRKLHGDPARPVDFLLANAERIRQAITQVETAFEAWMTHAQETRPLLNIAELVEHQREGLNQLWLLDLEESEAHQIQRLLPRPVVEPAQPRSVLEILCDLWGIEDESTSGTLPVKAKPQPKDISPALTPLDANSLIDALDAAFAGDGLE